MPTRGRYLRPEDCLFLVSLAVTLTIATALAAHSAEAQESHEGETAEATPEVL